MICVGHGAHGCAAGNQHHTGLAGRETENGVVAFTGGQLSERTGGTCHGGTLTGTELDVVDERTNRNFRERERVAQLRSDTATGSDNLTDLDAGRGDDVLLDAIFILDQGDAGAAVRIVLDGQNLGGAVVLRAEEVNDTVHFLVTATDITHGHLTRVITAAGPLKRLKKGLVRLLAGDLVKSADRHVPRTRGSGFEFTNCHNSVLLKH